MIELLAFLLICFIVLTCLMAPLVLVGKLICLPFQALAAILNAFAKRKN